MILECNGDFPSIYYAIRTEGCVTAQNKYVCHYATITGRGIILWVHQV